MIQLINSFFRPVYLMLFLCIFFPANAHAETRYVSDTLVISVRVGPGNEYQVIKTIKTGTAMTVLEDRENFIKVKTEGGVTGWVSKYYTDTALPKSKIIKRLEAKIRTLEAEAKKLTEQKKRLRSSSSNASTELANKLEDLEQQNLNYKQKNKELGTRYNSLKEKFDSVVEQSNNIVKTTKERNELKQKTYEMNQQLETLIGENKDLKDYKIIYWFLAGAGVLITGWLLGKVSRKGKRNLSF